MDVNKRLSELGSLVAVLHFAAVQLYAAECQRRDDPVATAKDFAKQIDDAFSVPLQVPPSFSPEELADLQSVARSFFAQIVATVQAQSGRADA